MAIAKWKLGLGLALIVGAICLAIPIILLSAVPVYSVGELLGTSPYLMVGRRVQLVGDFYNHTDERFILQDFVNDSYYVIVDKTGVILPQDVTDGQRLIVEGIFGKLGEDWFLQASVISTKCPSKYAPETTEAL